jgi:hypothetical protein
MTQRSLAVLIVLNLILLAALSVTVVSPTPASAQFGARSQFTMIAGAATGRSGQSVIYIVDLASSRIAPIFYNSSSKKFEFFTGRTISEDMGSAGTGGR